MTLLAALLLLAPPSPDPLAILGGRSVPYTEAEASAILQQYGRCMAQLNPKQAAMVLDQEFSSSNEKRVLITAHDKATRCWDGIKLRESFNRWTFIGLDTMLLRGAIAEGLLERSGWPAPPVRASAMFAVHQFARRDPTLDDKIRQASGVLLGIADCVVYASPVLVRSLAETRAQSVAERQAFTSLQPTVSACIPNAQTVTLDRRRFRAALAESLYVAASGAPIGAAVAAKQD